MPKKRKNGGKNRHNRGNVKKITCDATGKRVAKDKAIKRFYSKPLLSQPARKEVKEMSYYDRYEIPRLYRQQKFCVSEAQYHRVIYKRPKCLRKDDNIPYGVKQLQVKYGRKMDNPPPTRYWLHVKAPDDDKKKRKVMYQ